MVFDIIKVLCLFNSNLNYLTACMNLKKNRVYGLNNLAADLPFFPPDPHCGF